MPERARPVERLEMKVGNRWVPVEINSELRVVRGKIGRPRTPRVHRTERPVTCAYHLCKVRFLPERVTHKYCCANHRYAAHKLRHKDKTQEIDRKRKQRARDRKRKHKYEYVQRATNEIS